MRDTTFQGDLTCNEHGCNNKVWFTVVNAQVVGGGSYVAQYYTTVSGSYSIRVTVNNTELPNQYQTQVSSGQVRASNSSAVVELPSNRIIVAGSTVTVTVTARDVFGNLITRSDVQFGVLAEYVGSVITAVSAMAILDDSGFYAVSMKLNTAGNISCRSQTREHSCPIRRSLSACRCVQSGAKITVRVHNQCRLFCLYVVMSTLHQWCMFWAQAHSTFGVWCWENM